MAESTPTKVVEFLSPSAKNVCLVCQTIIHTPKEKVNTYSNSKKSLAGVIIEDFLGLSLNELSLSCLCRNCWRRLQNLDKKRREMIDQIKNGQELATSQFLRKRTKRQARNSENDNSSSRKRLTFIAEATPNFEEQNESKSPESLLQSLKLSSPKIFRDLVLEESSKVIREEINLLCSKKNPSSFRLNDVKSIATITYKSLETELKKKAPFVYQFLWDIVLNRRTRTSGQEKKEKLLPAIITAFSMLVFTRNQLMNTCPLLNACILHKGHAKKVTFQRLRKIGFCVSYSTVLSKLLDLGQGFDESVLQWNSENLREEEEFRREITNQLLSVESLPLCIEGKDIEKEHDDSIEVSFGELSLDRHNFTEDKVLSKRFMLVGDNVDFKVKRRHYLIEKSNLDMHLFHLIAVQNRIPVPMDLFTSGRTNYEVTNLPFSDFLPNEEDEKELRREVKILVGRDLLKHMKGLQWIKPFVPTHISHEYDKLVNEKSKVVSLGILDENENCNEGILQIMRHQHNYVAGSETKLLKMFTVGDLLTVERSQNSKLDVLDHPTSQDRLEGLIPAIADFHTYGNFLEAIWKLLYDTSSSPDIGTLYQARTFLNARSVPKDPMKDVNASEELLLKYSEALILSAYHSLGKEYKDQGDPKKNEVSFNNLMEELVDKVMMADGTDSDASMVNSCQSCGKKFKKMKNLRSHLIKKGHGNTRTEGDNKTDHIFNYARNALALCYLAKNFIDARKRGDGKRICRLYKYLMLYFKLVGKHKYAYQSLHLLAQIKLLLPPAMAHELVWNRFVNTKGFPDTNVELDRELEHRNKYFKEDLKEFNGKVTTKSIERCSKTYNQMQEITVNFDAMTNFKEPSGKHTKPDWQNDVLALQKQFVDENLFTIQEGRYFRSFPSVPSRYLDVLDLKAVKTWLTEKIKEWQKTNDLQNYTDTFNK